MTQQTRLNIDEQTQVREGRIYEKWQQKNSGKLKYLEDPMEYTVL